MMATLEEVAEALRRYSVKAVIIDVTHEHDEGGPVHGLNVWMGDPLARYPDDTVWPPFGQDGWVWGDKFQWGAHPDAEADTVATRVIETWRTRA